MTVTTHNLGFPRIGKQRELKIYLERYWQGQSDAQTLTMQARALREVHWGYQSQLDWVPVGDFSLYDHVLDMSFLLGNVPERAAHAPNSNANARPTAGDALLDSYFRLARGRSSHGDCGVTAGEMTKWFDTNYHYIVPELSKDTHFTLNPQTLLNQINEARSLGIPAKPVLIGPVTYLWLSKTKDASERLDYLDALLDTYQSVLRLLAQHDIQWVQIDEPILVTELAPHWQSALEKAYQALHAIGPKLLITTYFGALQDNLPLACALPSAGLHIDATHARGEIDAIVDRLPADNVLSLGVINGRNIWKTDLNATLNWLEPVADTLGDRLWIAPSCSLLHVPVDLNSEENLDPELNSWLAFALQKLDELTVLSTALNEGRNAVAQALGDNANAITTRQQSTRIHNPDVQRTVSAITPALAQRQSPYETRADLQQQNLNLPSFPTTTIGSFPQTPTIRNARLRFKKGELTSEEYTRLMRQEIAHSVQEQETLGLDVLVHGEAERNDMVEYFGEHLEGYAFTQYGWVQSYGSRCVKPPILFGDIRRPHAMTVPWITYAQSLTNKPLKGMLTGPVTMLNWSFVRDDQPRQVTCNQLALAIREEVLDLEKAGINIIQIDEAALREGLPLRRAAWKDYLDWAINAFRLCANGVQDKTQIHTHMCYSEFNDIIEAITNMDADVITIETSRSDRELLEVFNEFKYPNAIGPGVYDIHSPNIPSIDQIVQLMQHAGRYIPNERLWVNPDCGLKTRHWDEVIPALKNMVEAAHQLRERHTTSA